MTELLITSSLDPIKEGDSFSEGTRLPRHVTVWRYFELPDFHVNEFIAETGHAIKGFSPLDIEGTEYADFGPNSDIPVRRIRALGKQGQTLISLHGVLGSVIEKYDGETPDQEYIYEGYKPHVTYVDGRALAEGERATLRTVELIEKDADSHAKIVRKTWELTDV